MRRRGERLRDAASAIGIMRAAKNSGVPYGTLRDYMGGGEMKLSIVAALARACGVTIDWIANGNGAQARDVSSAGAREGPADAASPEVEPIDMDWLGRRLGLPAEELVAFLSRGDAMEPTVRDGDLLVAHRQERTIIVPAIYAIEVGGELLARRLEQRVDGTLAVRTDNGRYETQVLSAGQEWSFRVVGPVVWHAGPIRN